MSKHQSKSKSKKNQDRRNSLILLVAVVGGALLLLGAFLAFPKQETDPNFVAEVDGAPSLKADKEKIDFGDVRFNEMVTASFTLTNVGDEALRFTENPYVELKEGC